MTTLLLLLLLLEGWRPQHGRWPAAVPAAPTLLLLLLPLLLRQETTTANAPANAAAAAPSPVKVTGVLVQIRACCTTVRPRARSSSSCCSQASTAPAAAAAAATAATSISVGAQVGQVCRRGRGDVAVVAGVVEDGFDFVPGAAQEADVGGRLGGAAGTLRAASTIQIASRHTHSMRRPSHQPAAGKRCVALRCCCCRRHLWRRGLHSSPQNPRPPTAAAAAATAAQRATATPAQGRATTPGTGSSSSSSSTSTGSSSSGGGCSKADSAATEQRGFGQARRQPAPFCCKRLHQNIGPLLLLMMWRLLLLL